MPDTKISALTAAGTLDGTEVVPLLQGGANKRGTVAGIVARVLAALGGAANGLASLDGAGKVPTAQLPATNPSPYGTAVPLTVTSGAVTPDLTANPLGAFDYWTVQGTAGGAIQVNTPINVPAGKSAPLLMMLKPPTSGTCVFTIGGSGSTFSPSGTKVTLTSADDPYLFPLATYDAGATFSQAAGPAIRAVTGTSDTPLYSDGDRLIACRSGSATTVTANDLGDGVSYSVMQQGAGQVTVAAGSGVTLVSDKATPSYATARQGAVLTVLCRGNGTVFVLGNTA